MPQLASRVDDVPDPKTSDPDTERYLLFGAVLGLLEEACGQTSTVFILDDLHWADAQTLSLLRHAVSGGPNLPLLLIGTFRDSEVSHNSALSEALAALRREQGVERVALTGLTQGDVIQLMEAAAGHEMDELGLKLADEIASETDGNPFFVAEMLRHLIESDTLVRRDDGRWELKQGMDQLGLPESVREVVAQRVERLGEQAVSVLSLAALIGREFDLDLLERVARDTVEDVLDILESAVEASILVESGDRAGRFQFAHALISHTLYEDIGQPAVRGCTSVSPRRWRRSAGPIPAPVWANWPTTGRRNRERRREQGRGLQPQGRGEGAHRARPRRGRALVQPGARAPIPAAGDRSCRPHRPPHRHGDGSAPGWGRRVPRHPPEGRRTGARARRRRPLGRRRAGHSRGYTSEVGMVDDERVAMLRAAIETLPDGDARGARLRSLLAMEIQYGGAMEERRELSDRAVADARELGEPANLAHVMIERWFALWTTSTIDERNELRAEIGSVAEGLSDPLIDYWLVLLDSNLGHDTGDQERLVHALARCQEVSETVGEPFLLWLTMWVQGSWAISEGRLEEGEQLMEEGVAYGMENDQSDAMIIYAAQLSCLRREQGRMDEVIDLLVSTVDDTPNLRTASAFLAHAYLESGQPDEAREVLDGVLEGGLDDMDGRADVGNRHVPGGGGLCSPRPRRGRGGCPRTARAPRRLLGLEWGLRAGLHQPLRRDDGGHARPTRRGRRAPVRGRRGQRAPRSAAVRRPQSHRVGSHAAHERRRRAAGARADRAGAADGARPRLPRHRAPGRGAPGHRASRSPLDLDALLGPHGSRSTAGQRAASPASTEVTGS